MQRYQILLFALNLESELNLRADIEITIQIEGDSPITKVNLLNF